MRMTNKVIKLAVMIVIVAALPVRGIPRGYLLILSFLSIGVFGELELKDVLLDNEKNYCSNHFLGSFIFFGIVGNYWLVIVNQWFRCGGGRPQKSQRGGYCSDNDNSAAFTTHFATASEVCGG